MRLCVHGSPFLQISCLERTDQTPTDLEPTAWSVRLQILLLDPSGFAHQLGLDGWKSGPFEVHLVTPTGHDEKNGTIDSEGDSWSLKQPKNEPTRY